MRTVVRHSLRLNQSSPPFHKRCVSPLFEYDRYIPIPNGTVSLQTSWFRDSLVVIYGMLNIDAREVA